MSYRTIIRVLGSIPANGWHSTASIHARTVDAGAAMTKRSVERLLQSLAEEHDAPIESRGGESRGQAKEWRWRRRHPLQAHAHREAEIAETLLLHRMARHLLPPTLAKRLDEEERQARSELARNPDGDMAWWLDHVAALPPGPQRYPLPIADDRSESYSAKLDRHWDEQAWPSKETYGVYFLCGQRMTSSDLAVYIGKASHIVMGHRMYAHLNPYRKSDHYVRKSPDGDMRLEVMLAARVRQQEAQCLASALEEFLIQRNLKSARLLNHVGRRS